MSLRCLEFQPCKATQRKRPVVPGTGSGELAQGSWLRSPPTLGSALGATDTQATRAPVCGRRFDGVSRKTEQQFADPPPPGAFQLPETIVMLQVEGMVEASATHSLIGQWPWINRQGIEALASKAALKTFSSAGWRRIRRNASLVFAPRFIALWEQCSCRDHHHRRGCR